MIDRLGEQLGNYQLVRLLGRGGFAEVYLGRHIHHNTPVAIKVLQARLTSEDIEKFHNEARFIGRLKHPHIVQLRDFDIQNGYPFLVMDYAPNGTLRQRHQEGSRLPLTTIASYLKQVAAALQYAHEQNVIHRDVKPQNMLIGLNDEILLSDFGLAIISQSTSSQHIQNQAGTLLYMAPEQSEGQARYASDQYALGVVVYEWLCGKCPFHGTPIEIVMQHRLAPPAPFFRKSPYISQIVENVVFKSLAKNPKERFTSVQEFADAFEEAIRTPKQFNTTISASQTFVPALPQSPAINPRKRLSRTRAGILIGLLFLAILGGAGATYSLVNKNHINSLVTSTANGVMFGFDAQHTHFDHYEHVLNKTNVSHLVQDWSASTGDMIDSTPAVANGVVYVGSHDHDLYAFDAFTGKQVWVVSTRDAITSSPAVFNGVVYVGSQDHNFYALDAKTGKQLWIVSTGDQITSSPAMANGVVYVGSNDGNLYAFDASTGKRLWSTFIGGAIYSSPAVTNGVVYTSAVRDKLHALDAKTGKQLWAASAGLFIVSSPAVANGIVYIPSGTGYDVQRSKLYAFNARTGKLLWATSAGNHVSASPIVANGVVYIGSFDGNLYAFNASTGKQLWTNTNSTIGEITSSLTVANGTVYFGTNSGKLFAFHLLGTAP